MSPYSYRPAVGKRWLFLAAEAVWLGVGIMLIEFASGWLQVSASPIAYLIAGIALATCIYFFGFSKLARKNIRRIQSINLKRICLFAFQEWRSYPLVLVMIFLGIYLRMYSPIPKPLLAVLYIGIGGGLLSSSLHYFKHAFDSRLVGAGKPS
jgi:uncharacterized membrane protein